MPLLTADEKRTTIQPHQLPEAALKVPMMCNPGTKEGVTVKDGRFAGVWPANETFFIAVRGRGGLIGVAVDPLTAHECGNARYLAIPWLDVCLTARLPRRAGEALRSMPTEGAWLAALLSTEAQPAEAFQGEINQAVWLPNEAIAQAWQHYVKDTQIPDATPPPAPTKVRVIDGELVWEAEADLESGLAHFIIEQDGKALGTLPAQPKTLSDAPCFRVCNTATHLPSPWCSCAFLSPRQKQAANRTIA